jgi:cell fate regulator YaaT (PSP1 superfamily)
MEYLVSFGHAGEIGRFAAGLQLSCRRGDRVVVRGAQGLLLGTVVCDATSRHAQMLTDATVGELLRVATAEDRAIEKQVRERSQRLFDDARRLTVEQALPLEILDVEIQLDGHRVTLYFLRYAECDERPLVAALSKKYEVMVALRDLALPAGATACGKPDCGNSGGGCTSCSSGGGCGTGCGSPKLTADVREYFSGLREKMEQNHRVPLV